MGRAVSTPAAPPQNEALLALGQSALDRGDGSAAFGWFMAAARHGDARALNMAGRCHERGWGVRADAAAAARLYRAAVAGGDGWACFNLADLHLNGRGVARDPAAAQALYAQAARRGVAKALNMLGLLAVDRPDGTADARAFFRAGAAAGDCWAAFNEGRHLLAEGKAGQAEALFRQALEAGFPDFWNVMANALEGAAHEGIAALAARARAAAAGAAA